jgi:uncharacterized membrane protein
MTWFMYALSAAILWGIAQVLIKKGFENTSPLFNNFLSTIFSFLIFIPFALIGGVNWIILPKILFLVFLAAAPNFIYYYTANKGEISLTGTLMATYPIFTILLSALFLGEQTSVCQKLAILIIIIGSFLISKPKKFSLKLESWVVWGIVSSIIIGFADFMGKVTLMRANVYTFMFAFSIGYVVSLIITYIFDKNGRKFPKINDRKIIPTLIGTFMMELGVLLLYLGLSVGKASLVSPISSSYVALTVILAVAFLKDKATKTQWLGIMLTVAGVILIGI